MEQRNFQTNTKSQRVPRYLNTATLLYHFAMVGFKFQNFVRLQGICDKAYNGKLARIETVYIAGEYGVELQADEQIASHLCRKIRVKVKNMMRACDCCHQAGAATMQYCGRCRNAAY
jgi:hypothetical protein